MRVFDLKSSEYEILNWIWLYGDSTWSSEFDRYFGGIFFGELWHLSKKWNGKLELNE